MSIHPEWQWFGYAGHFIASAGCRFHLCTLVGDFLVSTVGDYHPNEIERTVPPLAVDHRSEYARFGRDMIGWRRNFETMVFRAGEPCTALDCGCGQPEIDGHELEMRGYQTAGEAARGHDRMCVIWSMRTAEDVAPMEAE